MSKRILSWKHVFNTCVGDTFWWHIDNAIDFVSKSGYQFFTWNGVVYDLQGNSTGITVDELV